MSTRGFNHCSTHHPTTVSGPASRMLTLNICYSPLILQSFAFLSSPKTSPTPPGIDPGSPKDSDVITYSLNGAGSHNSATVSSHELQTDHCRNTQCRMYDVCCRIAARSPLFTEIVNEIGINVYQGKWRRWMQTDHCRNPQSRMYTVCCGIALIHGNCEWDRDQCLSRLVISLASRFFTVKTVLTCCVLESPWLVILLRLLIPTMIVYSTAVETLTLILGMSYRWFRTSSSLRSLLQTRRSCSRHRIRIFIIITNDDSLYWGFKLQSFESLRPFVLFRLVDATGDAAGIAGVRVASRRMTWKKKWLLRWGYFYLTTSSRGDGPKTYLLLISHMPSTARGDSRSSNGLIVLSIFYAGIGGSIQILVWPNLLVNTRTVPHEVDRKSHDSTVRRDERIS